MVLTRVRLGESECMSRYAPEVDWHRVTDAFMLAQTVWPAGHEALHAG